MATSLFFLYGLVLVSVTHSQIREYHFINLNLTWTAARHYCREHYTDLATVEREDLQRMFVPDGVVAWIGLFDDPASWYRSMTTDSNSWRWSATGDSGQIIGWKDYQPNFSGAADKCTVMDRIGWNDVVCSRKYLATCYTVESSTKQFTLSNIAMTWEQARDYCREHHHDLAMIESLDEYKVVQSLGTSAWIGLYREPWKWSDNSNSSFKNWGESEPNNNNGNEHCVAMGSDLSWIDDNCERQLPFICHKTSIQRFFQLKLQSTADLSNPINSQIIKAINMKLGVNMSDFKIKRARS